MTTQVKDDEINIVWVTNFWDIPLAGLCRYKGRLCKFNCVEQGYWEPIEEEGVDEDDWDDRWIESIYEVTSLTWREKIQWKIRQKKFEFFVGKHWSYKNGKRGAAFGTKRPKWFVKWAFNWYYSRKRC